MSKKDGKTQPEDGRPDAVKKLQDYANEKGINMPAQIAITNHFFSGGDQLFNELDRYDAAAILDGFDKKGHTWWINKATGQTDITDSESDERGLTGETNNALSQMLDESTGEVVAVSDGMREWAHKIHNYMEADAITKAFIWSVFRSERLYLAFGCSSMKEYANDISSIGLSTIESYLTIGDRFFSALKQIKTLTVRLDDDPETFFKELKADPEIAELGKLGHRKLREIGKQGDEKIKQLIKKKEITFDDGTTITQDEILSFTAREFEQKNKEREKQKNRRIASLEEDKKKYRDERDRYREQLEKDKERIERSYEIEMKYGEKAVRMQEIEHLLDKAEAGMLQLERHFGQIDLDYDDPEGLRERALSLIRRMTLQMEGARRRFSFFAEDLDNFALFPTWKLKENGDGRPETGLKDEKGDI